MNSLLKITQFLFRLRLEKLSLRQWPHLSRLKTMSELRQASELCLKKGPLPAPCTSTWRSSPLQNIRPTQMLKEG